jgi:hypothetical protein
MRKVSLAEERRVAMALRAPWAGDTTSVVGGKSAERAILYNWETYSHRKEEVRLNKEVTAKQDG